VWISEADLALLSHVSARNSINATEICLQSSRDSVLQIGVALRLPPHQDPRERLLTVH
jgi:hypothetical protein